MSGTTKEMDTAQENEHSVLENKFLACVDKAQNSSEKPNKPISNEMKLEIYGLYKQATQGDVSGPKPAFLDLVGRAKYKAWEGFKGMETYEAMQKYIDIFDSLA